MTAFLTRDEELALAIRWRDHKDERAMHAIVEAHQPLVKKIAFRYRGYGLPIDEMIQEGRVGLLEAVNRFDPDQGFRVSTYATWWIKAHMQAYVLRNWSIVRGGTSQKHKALFFNIRRLRNKLPLSGSEMHRKISELLGVEENDVAVLDARLSGEVSLNAPTAQGGEESTYRMDALVSDEPLPDEIVGNRIDHARQCAKLHNALSTLNTREQMIIRARWLAEDGATLDTLGNRLGISKERVRQLETRAMQGLRRAMGVPA